ncbi:MAG TPA: hypothetical protein PLS39_05235, partial [Accumulibacter sp.]|nr:hypothetical protein [Accumulibacter sp.]HNC17282.1 hypothetical protein [Accumulibacter sp.]HND79824.1 hypothetical protein [Accumulibacter sp.]HNO57080.1 hypothetical protein [Accumulibacter sp.]
TGPGQACLRLQGGFFHIKKLMAAAGSQAATPSQLFRPEVWKVIFGVYLGPPPLSKRGSFQLLV